MLDEDLERKDAKIDLKQWIMKIMLVGVLGARHLDNDRDRIDVIMKCHLDHEDYVSLRSPSILPYA